MTTSNGATVLIAEDDPSTSEMLEEMLRWEGYRIEVVETAQEAVAALRAARFAAVLLDLTMPGMTRDEFMAALCSLPAVSPLIVFSARPAFEVDEVASRLRAAAVLSKPSSIELILATIHRLAGQPPREASSSS